MNAIDATERGERHDEAAPPCLLVVILDTNPHAWALLADSLPLSRAVANLLVFLNAHLAINNANKVAILASHVERAEWLYPDPVESLKAKSLRSNDASANGTEPEISDGDAPERRDDFQSIGSANKYRPFANLEHTSLNNLKRLVANTTTDSLSATPSTMMAGALTLALSYISKQTATMPAAGPRTQFNYSDPSSVAGGNDLSTDASNGQAILGLTSRLMVLSVSGDLAHQYIPVMNSIFAYQRLNIPIDILKLAGDTVFLQQAADATGGIYLALNDPAQMLQYLMFAYLPDQSARAHLVLPGEGDGVDFRAACFCHRKIVDIGFVCSICLSIFCEPLPDNLCLTCGSHLSMSNFGQNPVVVPKKKKKKKRQLDGTGMNTPTSGRATPIA